MPNYYNWLDLAGIPGTKTGRDAKNNVTGGIYTGGIAVASPDGKTVYCVLQCINKNRASSWGDMVERHELIILVASNNGVQLVERLVQRQEFQGHLGGPAFCMTEGNTLHITCSMDFDERYKSRFPAYAFTVDGNQRKDARTHQVDYPVMR